MKTSDNNSFIRFEYFSFDPSKNPQVTGKSYNLKGLLVHYSTIDIFQNMTNIDIVLKKLKIILYNIFSLFIYDDLKTFLLDIDLFFYIIKMLNIKLRKSF